MDSNEKRQFTLMIKSIPYFKNTFEGLVMDRELDDKEKTYLLSIALIFFEEFEKDNRYTSFLEFGYYIVLKYAIKYRDFRPLYDFSINFGFYPIAYVIQKNGLIKEMNLLNQLSSIKLEDYKHQNYIETLEQQDVRIEVLKQESLNVSYIAPTSYGKSSLIKEHIQKNFYTNKKVGIIVPTKSLLTQTYKEIRKSNFNRRIITHDEMYNTEAEFIGVLTQERALRLLEKNSMSFDILYIDEAHNLFEKNNRSILLSRLIRQNQKLNPNQKVVYLSPLINDSENLKIDNNQKMVEQKIKFNMKVPEIFEVKNNKIYLYNRFSNEFYPYTTLEIEKNVPYYIKYILNEKGYKNFVYHRTPRKIEEFANELYEHTDMLEINPQIQKLINEIQDFVHKDFYVVKFLSKGIIYLHGKMPEIVKEYLEFQFKKMPDLRFVVANKVILEGINLPIDKLFVMHTNHLNKKDVTNLIGRVNRLNEIFNDENSDLSKLLPSVHFINSHYNKKSIKMENLIKKLRSNIFKDEIKNPTLQNFNIKDNFDEKNLEKINEIRENENAILKVPSNEKERVKRIFLKSSLQEMVLINDNYLDEIILRVEKNKNSNEWIEMDILEKINNLFIRNFDRDTIFDFEINRLKYDSTRTFYRNHIFYKNTRTLKENIFSTYQYFLRRISEGEADIFIGASYGEKTVSTEYYSESYREYYVDLSTKSESELINLAIIKLKLEDDFISYKLNKLVVILYDLEMITEDEYNEAVYGTNDKLKIDLLKTGFSIGLLSQLEKDNQLKNLRFNEYNNVVVTDDFLDYKSTLNGFNQFEIQKYL